MDEKKSLRILVVDDNPKNLESALLLAEEGHTVDVASTLKEALEELTGYDYCSTQMFREPKTERKYDVVLTDMNFPMGGNEYCSGKIKAHDVQPLGYAMMLAAARQKVPYIAILTDCNHHEGPIASTFDMLYGSEGVEPMRHPFKVDESKVMFFDVRDVNPSFITPAGKFREGDSPTIEWESTKEEVEHYNSLSREEQEKQYPPCKNWKHALERIINEDYK